MKKSVSLFSAFGLAQIATLLAVVVALWLAYEPWRWGRLKEEVRGRFPTVPFITAEALGVWLKEPVLQPILLDARSEQEYHASHLPGALPAKTPLAQLGLEGKFDQPIVVYCSAGFESAPAALRFLAQGFKRVQYLEGGIFLWANHGRPLENVKGPTSTVDPGKSPHVRFLESKHRL